ncbi:hypothetical protein ACOMHN_017421 [Nucella lapillus]
MSLLNVEGEISVTAARQTKDLRKRAPGPVGSVRVSRGCLAVCIPGVPGCGGHATIPGVPGCGGHAKGIQGVPGCGGHAKGIPGVPGCGYPGGTWLWRACQGYPGGAWLWRACRDDLGCNPKSESREREP